MPPKANKRKRVAATAAAAVAPAADEMADSVTTNGLEISIETGDLFAVKADAIAFAVDERLHGPMRDHFAKAVGGKVFEEAFTKATGTVKRSVMQGEILPVDVSANDRLPVKYALLVVRPMAPHLKMAYKAILQFAVNKNLQTLAIPGLGCGGTDVDPSVSSQKLLDTITEWQGGFKGVPKKIIVLDKNVTTVDAFKDKFGLTAGGSSGAKSRRTGGAAAAGPVGGGPATAEQIVAASTVLAVEIEEIDCPVCMEPLQGGEGGQVVQLTICGHQIHNDCFVNLIKGSPRRACFICGVFFWTPTGNMPPGSMTHSVHSSAVEGYPDAQGCIIISYSFAGGIQGPEHPRPGVHYTGTSRHAYLPNNDEGRLVLRLLQKAFECKLTFTVGDSVTSGQQNTVVWNNVHHKTSLHGGAQAFGYPDPTYLSRLKDELAGLGITEAMLA